MNFTEIINANYKFLNGNDIHILKYIVNNKQKVSTMTIENLAEMCNVSRTTILRLCKKLDFKGYSEFKTFLKWDIASKTTVKHDGIKEIQRSFNETMLILKNKDIEEICKSLDCCERIFVYGTGNAQRIFADELKRVFLFQNKYLHVIKGEKELDICLENFTNKDMIIVISHSGNSDGLINYLQKLVLKGTTILSITTAESNYLASIANYNLFGYSATYSISETDSYNSSFFYFIILEALFVSYAEYCNNKVEKLLDVEEKLISNG